MSSAADRRRAAATMVPRMGELRTPRLGGSPGELEENQQWIYGNIKMPSGSGAVAPLAKIRSDTCRILEETIPLIKDKLMEMYHICAKADKLEAFVKMVAHCVSFLEDQT